MFEIYEKLTDEEDHHDIFDELELDYEQRNRSRLKAVSVNGHNVGVFLPRGQQLSTGALLRCDNGNHFKVKAALEDVVTVFCEHPRDLAQICYHLGCLHIPVQVGDHSFRFKANQTVEMFVQKRGLAMTHHQEAFDPEAALSPSTGH